MIIWKNSYFKYTFWSLIIADVFFFWAHEIKTFETILFIIICLSLIYLFNKKIEFAVYIPLLELFIGSQGHLIDLNIKGFDLSLRTAIFIIAFCSGLIYLIKQSKIDFKKSSYFIPFLIYIIILIWGAVLAIFYKRPLTNIFLDVNGYLFILILPIFYQIIRTKKLLKNLLYIFFATSLFFSLKTIASFYLFIHQFDFINIRTVYKFLRDLRIGEITKLDNGFYRIFFQSQIYIVISLIINFCILTFQKIINKKDKVFIIILSILNLTVILISLSRSFWIGLIAFLLTLLIWFLFNKVKFKMIIITYAKFICIMILSILFIFLLIKIPYTSINLTDLFSSRLTESEEASNSRLILLPHMINSIKTNPILGNGLAYEITYESKDPRHITDDNPNGQITTYSFEWGWLNIWLKFGIFGFLLYLFIVLKIIIDSVKLSLNKGQNIILIIAFSVIAISVIHIFSPYLDHPLGIGLLIISIIILDKLK